MPSLGLALVPSAGACLCPPLASSKNLSLTNQGLGTLSTVAIKKRHGALYRVMV